MRYISEVSPRALRTVKDPLSGYPQVWELLRWYKCWRKYPYPSEVIAAIMSGERADEYHHYPCREDSSHWHIGRGDGHATTRQLIQSAKRRYRRAVRDEIWAEYEERKRVVRQEEEASVASSNA